MKKTAVFLLVLGLAIPAVLFAMAGGKPLVIVSAEVTNYGQTPYTLQIRVQNSGPYTPVVMWASVPVAVAEFQALQNDWQIIKVQLPTEQPGGTNPAPGSYRLQVMRASKQGKALEDPESSDVFYVTIAAAGLQGPPGAVGPPGPQGPPGPAGGAAAGRCFDNVNRFVDCGNGTVTDTQSGLIWLKNPGCFPPMDYASANNAAAGLQSGQCGLTDGSDAGSWRLPTKWEWADLLRADCYAPGSPTLPDSTGFGCFDVASSGPWATGVHAQAYWSSTASADSLGAAYFASLVYGFVDYLARSNTYLVWPVRGGNQ